MNIAKESLRNTGPTSSDTETSEPLPMSSEWICSAVDSPVNLSVWPANAEGNPTSDGYGLSFADCFAFYDPATHLLKTRQVSLLSECMTFSETLPRSGLMRNGMLFQRPPLVPLTSGNGFGYLPTLQASSDSMNERLNAGNASTCYRKANGESRPSGAKIGSSLRWSQEFVNEWLRTGGNLNPEWLEVLMGYPIGWTEITPAATLSSRKSPNGSESESSNTTVAQQ